MYPVILTIHVIVAALLILVVLIQSGRSGGFSSLMGGGGGDALFSTSGQQSGIRKATFILAMIFLATSFVLTIVSNKENVKSVLQRQFPALPPLPSSETPATNAPIGMPSVDKNANPEGLAATPIKK